MISLMEITIYKDEVAIMEDSAIITHKKIKKRDIHRVLSKLYSDKITNISYDGNWTFSLEGGFNGIILFSNPPVISL